MIKVLSYTLVFLGIWILFFKNDTVEYGPGVLAPNEPLQTKIESSKAFVSKGDIITPLANFELQAKVLSKENYSHDRGAKHSPVDLALGWGRMSDESVLSHLDISQSGRWYRWETQEFPIPRREIETNSANMHMVPKDEEIASVLEEVREGDIVHLKGKLIRIDAQDKGHWKSSFFRTDTGSGACELIFVEELQIQTPTSY